MQLVKQNKGLIEAKKKRVKALEQTDLALEKLLVEKDIKKADAAITKEEAIERQKKTRYEAELRKLIMERKE